MEEIIMAHRFPIGIQTFESMRNDDYVCVDKREFYQSEFITLKEYNKKFNNYNAIARHRETGE
jgi:hypothetical protein